MPDAETRIYETEDWDGTLFIGAIRDGKVRYIPLPPDASPQRRELARRIVAAEVERATKT